MLWEHLATPDTPNSERLTFEKNHGCHQRQLLEKLVLYLIFRMICPFGLNLIDPRFRLTVFAQGASIGSTNDPSFIRRGDPMITPRRSCISTRPIPRTFFFENLKSSRSRQLRSMAGAPPYSYANRIISNYIK